MGKGCGCNRFLFVFFVVVVAVVVIVMALFMIYDVVAIVEFCMSCLFVGIIYVYVCVCVLLVSKSSWFDSISVSVFGLLAVDLSFLCENVFVFGPNTFALVKTNKKPNYSAKNVIEKKWCTNLR